MIKANAIEANAIEANAIKANTIEANTIEANVTIGEFNFKIPGLLTTILKFTDGTELSLKSRYIYSFYNTKYLNFKVTLTENQYRIKDTVSVSCIYYANTSTESEVIKNLIVKIEENRS
jgi:hypothetical protein